MKIYSPLRYPGGKSPMAGLLSQIRYLNRLGDRAVAEPFAGGAGASLTLLYLEDTPAIYINDADGAIHDFWWSVLNRPKQFAALLSRTRVSMAEWYRQRETYRRPAGVSRLKKGFAAFYLNRCNRSGIIVNGGPIGGTRQRGRWKLNARYNKPDLLRRCARVAEYEDRVSVSGCDGMNLLNSLDPKTTFFFIDPPYFTKGQTLYLDVLDRDYHAALASRLRAMSDAAWVLTYDDCAEVREMYRDWATVRPFSLRYTAAARRRGREVLVAPRWMRLPASQDSASVKW